MYFVYILKLINNCFYKGLTNNIERRLMQHGQGRVAATRNKLPYKLLHVEICSNRKEARILEKYFKSGFGREIIKDLAS